MLNRRAAAFAPLTASLLSAPLMLATAGRPAAAQASPPTTIAPAAPSGCGSAEPFDSDDEAREPTCLALLGPLASRDGATLTLKLANGTTKSIVNQGGTPLGRDKNGKPVTAWDKSFSLVTFDPEAGVFLLRTSGTFVAVDARSGRETDFGADFPHYAPGSTLALTISRETSAATLRDTSATPAKVVWKNVPKQHLNRSFIAWDGDRRARLLVEDTATAFIVRDAAGRWTYNMIAMDEPIIETPSSCMPEPSAKDSKSIDCLAKLSGAVIDNGTLLSLRLEDGSRKRLLGDDTGGFSTYRHYGLVGFDAAAHAYVVGIGYYEGSGMLIVDSRTGAETDLGDGADVPWFSPNRSRFIVTSSGDEQNNPAGTDVRIFSWGTKPKKLWSYAVSERPNAIDHVAGWEGDRRFGLVLADGRKAAVVLDDKGRWRYDAPAAPAPAPVDKP